MAMTFLDPASATMRFSGEAIAGSPQSHVLREMFGRGYINVDFEFFGEHQRLDAFLWELPGISIGSGSLSPAVSRTHDSSRENDDLVLAGGFGPKGSIECRGREASSGDGTSVLYRKCDPMAGYNQAGWVPRIVSIRKGLLEDRIADLDDQVMRPLFGSDPVMRLLDAYLPLACTTSVMHSPALAQAAALHVSDLIVLAVGGRRDAVYNASQRGLAQARLAVIRHWITRRHSDPTLTIDRVARAHAVSPRTIQADFQREGSSFSTFLLGVRLRAVHDQLIDRALTAVPISALAYGAGFSDLSYFNRRFREHYGCTPSDARSRVPAP